MSICQGQNANEKTKIEIKHMASVIAQEKGKYMFNIKEIASILGISRDTTRNLLNEIPSTEVGCSKRYFIENVLEFVYK